MYMLQQLAHFVQGGGGQRLQDGAHHGYFRAQSGEMVQKFKSLSGTVVHVKQRRVQFGTLQSECLPEAALSYFDNWRPPWWKHNAAEEEYIIYIY